MVATMTDAGIKKSIDFAIAIGVLVSMLVGVVLWGLKLDTNINELQREVLSQVQRVARIEAMNERGLLPIAEERIAALREDLVHVRAELDAFIKDHNRRFVPATHLQDDIESLKESIDELEREARLP